MARMNFYRLPASAMFAARCDPRFHYCTYVPESYDPEGSRSYPLAVLIHHSKRDAQALRDRFIAFAEVHQCALLAPLFPCGINGVDDFNNYKLLRHGGVAYDQVLLEMIEEISEVFHLQTNRVLMYGFSGGGQFAHRFLLRHPDRLRGISIAAPGTVTLPGDPRGWWVGTGDMEDVTGAPLNPGKIREVPIQLLVGADDLGPEGMTIGPGSDFWCEGANDAGATRVARLSALEAALRDLGAAPERQDLPGVGHDAVAVQPPVENFFGRLLAG
ncbi:alpha/beta hydrolase [Qingshengfaniella alkalisoli]|uniref:Alpha/beta hydrolase n=1 Tax=Qingshengfaniella alkalisoli TaxID=2599296 RepID=A0A5B8IAL7_9RHOB|nr:alpha/beta hydrolase [Qingshengfaniella alkalisoli]QDY70356.1 alpha/beta hydrolase [Qingshengfaniella alkalisoli]